MSFEQFEQDILAGNLSHAYERAKDYVVGTLEPDAFSFAKKVGSDEYKAVIAAVEKQVPAVKADPLNLEVWITAAKSAFMEAAEALPGVLIQDIYALLNIKVAA